MTNDTTARNENTSHSDVKIGFTIVDANKKC